VCVLPQRRFREQRGEVGVTVEFDGSPVPVEVKAVDPDLLAELGLESEFRIYFAEITDFLDGGRVEIEATNREGSVVAQRSLQLAAPLMPRLSPRRR